MKHTLTLYALAVLVLLTGCSDGNDSPANAAPLLARYVLSSPDSVPEGIAFDPIDRAFYATSLQGGSITRVDADGTERIFRAADNNVRIGGAKVAASQRQLWVCTQRLDTLDDRIAVYDLDSAEQTMEFLLGALSTNGSCNDLAIAPDGFVYVTDPDNPNLYRLDPTSGEGEVFASDPLFTDLTGQGLGLNGITVTADGNALIVARFFPAALLRVALPNAASITEVALSGDTLPAPDGLVELDGDIYSVSNSSVSRTRLGADGRSGTVTVLPQISGLSTGTAAESALYVIKSDVTSFVLEQPLNPPFEIFSIDLADFDQ
ncbi:MAG: SMP-30/gluconolactonase/LRE family protein [Gammaproteobacteria bacterium]|nr:SMP-30/gluconolactonase/LRE family protein [Gammaproteobacteria bacterium]